MKISYRWLRELVEMDLSTRELADTLTRLGLAVDTVETMGDDAILDLDLTTNRPDALSHMGVAREVALMVGRGVKPPPVDAVEDEQAASALTSVEILDPDLCPRYTARLIMDVQVGPSPQWLVEKLERLGQRSVNNVADITNFVLWEVGQPTHAFDFDKLIERRIVVRRARAGETLITLDGVKRDLTDEMLVIADGARPVAMAGIMGGEETEISFQTKHVLLESAYFQPQSVRRTARALGMETEASYHFERGMDPEMPPRAADRVARLIQEVAGGRVLRGIVDAYPRPAQLKPLRLRQARMSRLLGFEVAMDEAVRILDGLGFHVERLSATELAAVAPSWRVDIDGEDDLVEEVARHVGYEKIQTELPASVGAGEYLSGEAQRREVRRTLASLGFDEAITLSFVNEERNVQFQDEGAVLLPLCNPIDETRSSMRASLLPGLLESLTNNLNHGVRNVRLFEIGKTFMGQGNDRPREREQLALVATGLINEGDWKDQKDVFDFHQLKGVLEGLLDKFRVSEYSLDHARRSYLHPGRAAALVVGGEELAVFGQLHPKVAASYKYKQPVLVATVDVERLLAMKGEGIRYHPLPRFPVVVRDISFLVSVDVGYQEIREAIGALGISELVEVRLFDVYTGAHVPAGQRSLSLSLHLRAADHTLTEDEIKSLFDQVVTRLRVRCGAEIRQ